MGCCQSNSVPYVREEDIEDGHDMGRTGSLSADSVLRAEYEEQKSNNKNIDKYMEYQRRMEQRVKKLLLLGAGSSGKSTLFKQLKQIYKYGLDESEYVESKFVIRSNCISSILILLKKSQLLYETDDILHSDCHIDLETNQEIIEHIQCVLNYATPNSLKQSVEELSTQNATDLYESISYLWGLKEVKATFNKRQYFSFIENMDYFFSKLDIIFNTEYEASIEDTLKCRIRTTGLIEEKYIINDVQFNIFDAGGQRNERKKWIQLFEGVTAIVFVAALNHYATVLFEEETKNSMHESLELFDEICNQKWFRKTEIILFLNKDDLFRQRLKEGIPLTVCFGDNYKGDRYKGPTYVPQDDIEKDEEEFKTVHAESCEFIRQQYEKLNRNPYKKIFVHITTATNKENIESVFWDVQNIIVSGNMKTSGLV